MMSRHDELFWDTTYLHLKNQLFSYQLRKRHLRPFLLRACDQWTLDLGCGVSPIAAPAASVIYVDIAPQAMSHLSRQYPEAAFVVADVTKLPFRDGTVAQIVCSEVLEHVEQHERTLDEMSRLLTPGGRLVISVPLHPYYYTFDDRYVGHYRRYVLDELLRALELRGFTGLRTRRVAAVLEKLATYVMARLFALMATRSAPKSASGTGQRWWFGLYRTANALWSHVCALEAKVAPWGLTTIVSIQARKTVESRGKANG